LNDISKSSEKNLNEREAKQERERDTLCNVLSTNHRKFGEQFPSIFIPKLYRANKNGTNPKTEKEQREQSKMGATIE
jgi:hypothetical protein